MARVSDGTLAKQSLSVEARRALYALCASPPNKVDAQSEARQLLFTRIAGSLEEYDAIVRAIVQNCYDAILMLGSTEPTGNRRIRKCLSLLADFLRRDRPSNAVLHEVVGLFQCYRETSTRSAALAAEKERDPFFPAMGTEEKEGEEVDVEWESIDAAWRSLWLVLKQNLESGGGSDDESHSDAAALVFRARGHTSDNNDAGEQMTYTSVFEVKRGRNLKGIEVKPRGKDGGGGSAKARESKILFEAKFHKLLAQTRLSRSIKQYTSSLSGKEKHGGGLAKRRTMNRGGLRATPYREQPALHLPVEALEEALMPFFSIGRSQRRWSSGRSTSSSSSSFRDIKHEKIQQHDTNKNLVASVSVLAKLLVDCYIKDRDEGVEIAVALFGSLLGNASSRGSARSAVFDVLYTISAHALLLDRRDRRNGTPETSSSSSSSEELQDWILKIVLELMELLMANNESNEDVWFSAFGCLLHLTVKGDDQVLASHTHLPNAYLAKHLVERGDFFRWPAPVRAMTIKYFLASLLQPRRDGEIEEVDRATLEKVGGMRCLLEIVWTAPSESIEGCLRHIALACLGEHETNNTLSKAQIIYAIVTQLGGMMLTVADEAREVVELNFLSPLQGSRDFLRSQPTAGDNNVIVSILTKVAREAEDMSSALLAEIPSHSAAEDTISSLLSFFSSEDLGTRLCAVAWVKSCVINVTRLPVPKRREVLNFLEALCLKGSRGILLVSKGLKNAQEALSKTSSRKNEAITATRMVISLVLKAHKRSAQSDGGEDILSWIDSAIFMGDSLVSSWKAASESSPSQRDIKMFDALSELTKLKQRIRMLSPVRWDSVSQLRVSILTKVIPSSMDSEETASSLILPLLDDEDAAIVYLASIATIHYLEKYKYKRYFQHLRALLGHAQTTSDVTLINNPIMQVKGIRSLEETSGGTLSRMMED